MFHPFNISPDKIMNLKGEEQRIHVNFEDSFSKIFSFICNKNGYKKKVDLCVVSLETQKESTSYTLLELISSS